MQIFLKVYFNQYHLVFNKTHRVKREKDFLKTHHADRKVVVDNIVGHPITVPGQEDVIYIFKLYHSFSSIGILGQ